jgi:glycine cleavage system protein P-like pyridoxal-binding family
MQNIKVAILNGSYMFHLQSSHHQDPYVTNTKGNHTLVVYINLKMITGIYLGVTNEDISKIHIKKHLL